VHFERPVVEATLPTSHDKHDASFPVTLYVPIAQSLHDRDFVS
jgi:hypothetical protein